MLGEDNEKERQNQTTSCYIRRNQTENILRPLWGNQAENHQEHLQVDSQREKKLEKNTNSKYIEHNCGYRWFETTG